MQKVTVTRKLEFDAGHRVLGHEGKCKNIHGHRYVVEITCSAPDLDLLQRVIDFGKIKEKVGKWIDANWDHNLLLNKADPLSELWENDDTTQVFASDGKISSVRNRQLLFSGVEPYLFEGNPTAEMIAKELFEIASHLLISETLDVEKVRVWETPNCYAEVCCAE